MEIRSACPASSAACHVLFQMASGKDRSVPSKALAQLLPDEWGQASSAGFSAVRAGLGLAQLPLWMVEDDIRTGKLSTVLDGLSGGELPVDLLWPRMPTLVRIRVVVDELLQNSVVCHKRDPS